MDKNKMGRILEAIKKSGNVGISAKQIREKTSVEESPSKIGQYLSHNDDELPIKTRERSVGNKYVWDG